MTDDPLRATVTLRGVVFGPDDDVLVLRRSSDGGWELPGGRLDRGEEPLAGVRREVREETGLDPSVVEPVHTFAWVNERDRGRFAVYYRCSGTSRHVSLSPEHDDSRWRGPEAAAETLTDVQGRAVARAVEARDRAAGAAEPEVSRTPPAERS